MLKLSYKILVIIMLVASCASDLPPIGADGKPLPKIYSLSKQKSAEVQFRMLDAVNALRNSSGAQGVNLNSRLNAAAATHSRDMSIQNRPWHFGSDGSSPLDRVQRVGYLGILSGEIISETYETELETLSAWMKDENTRRVLLDPKPTEMGFSWYQEISGKIWWTLVLGENKPLEKSAKGE
tara:strand:- start:51 stop:593 length:543 start_codon:yes stop_codon:yes gene_type:complete